MTLLKICQALMSMEQYERAFCISLPNLMNISAEHDVSHPTLNSCTVPMT